MPLNFGLLQPVDIGARFTAGQESVQRNQLAQQQRQQDQELNALRMQQMRSAVSQQERQVKAETATQKTAMFRDRLQRARDPNAVRELVKMQYADPDLGPILSQTGTLEQALAEVPDDPAQFELHRQQEIMGMSEWMKSQLPKVVGNAVFNPATNTFLTPPDRPVAPKEFTPPASVLEFERAQKDPEYLNFLRQRAEATRAPVPVKATGGGGGGAAPAPKPMTELQQQTSRKVMAADKTSVKNSQSVVDELEKLTDELVGNPEKGISPDPGLSGISGYQALLPSLPKSDARKAQQKLETMKGKVMAFGRQLASLEGKLGNMAVQEWKFVSDSIQALDPAAGNLDVQLRDIVRQAKNFATTVQERYDLTYEGTDSAVATPVAPLRAVDQIPGQKLAPAGTGGFRYLGKEGSK
jgi:hypothetical protein